MSEKLLTYLLERGLLTAKQADQLREKQKESGKTIREVDVRNKYRVNIIAIRDGSMGEVNVSHGAEYVLRESDILLILGEDKYIDAVCAL